MTNMVVVRLTRNDYSKMLHSCGRQLNFNPFCRSKLLRKVFCWTNRKQTGFISVQYIRRNLMSRVRMPHNNRVSASSALRTNDMWSKTIGYDPYAAVEEKREPEQDTSGQAASLMLLAKMSNLSGVESRGGCKKCGMLGHMTFQCRNAVAPTEQQNDSSDSSSSSDSDSDGGRNDRTIRAKVEPVVSAPKETERRSESDLKRSKRNRDHSDDDDDDDDSSRDRKHKKSKSEKKEKDKKHKHRKEKKQKHHKHKKSHKSSK